MINQTDSVFSNNLLIKLINQIFKNGNKLLGEKMIYKVIHQLNGNSIKNLLFFLKIHKNKKDQIQVNCFFSQCWQKNSESIKNFRSFFFLEFIELLTNKVVPIIGLKEKKHKRKKKLQKPTLPLYYKVIREEKLITLGLKRLVLNKVNTPFLIPYLIQEYKNIKEEKSEYIIKKKEMYQLFVKNQRFMRIRV